MKCLLYTQHVKIADSNHLGFFFFKKKVPVQVYVCSFPEEDKSVRLFSCSSLYFPLSAL